MPKIYEYFGMVFLLRANDHTPIHIHVRYGNYESKIEFIYTKGVLVKMNVKKVSGKKPLPANKMSEAIKLAKIKESDITAKWLDFYGKDISPKCQIITKKIK